MRSKKKRGFANFFHLCYLLPMNMHNPQFVNNACEKTSIDTIKAEALRIFGSELKAASWLSSKISALNNKSPLQVMRSQEGTEKVRMLLGQIDHGIFS
jgi:uncharacterized protein (DUF2384 family)